MCQLDGWQHEVLLSAEVMMEGVSEPDRLLHSTKGTRQLSYI